MTNHTRARAQTSESDIRQFADVSHPFHGRGVVSTLSSDRQYAVVRYPAGYLRTHRIRDLTPVTLPAEGRA